jgi:hypothetical protein
MYLNIKYLIVFFLSTICINIGLTQVLKGKVIGLNNHVLINANVILIDTSKNLIGTITDEKGFYNLNIPTLGKYNLICSYVGYEDKKILLTIDSFENLQIDISLNPQIEGDYITITEKPYQSGDLTMTQNQYKVMPASFQDPARILIKYPGFSTPNDGANAIIFRGMPPESARWQLFGADIVNPNHLSNAGTANDLATGNAGGVNALSGSVLDYYHFEASPADISYSNVMSGISNMKMAPKINSFVDINLIGLEAGYGTQMGNKNIYGSYRYSFVGLLDKLGVNFGNEKIGYQDLSLYCDIIKDNTNNLKFFSTYGHSTNIHTAVSQGDSSTKFKDILNINFENKIGIAGLDFTHFTKYNDRFQSTIVGSMLENSRHEVTDFDWLHTTGLYTDSRNMSKQGLISSHTSFTSDFDNTLQMSIGLRINSHFNRNFLNSVEIGPNNYFSAYTYMKFSQIKIKQLPLELDFGSGLYVDSKEKKVNPEPSVTIKYIRNERSKFILEFRHAGFENYINPFIRLPVIPDNRILGSHVQLSYDFNKDEIKWNSQVFYHHFYNITNFVFANDTSNILNLFNGSTGGYDFLNEKKILNKNQTSTARVFGVSTNCNSNLSKRLRFQINGSIFTSQYTLPDDKNKYYNGRYDFGVTSGGMLSYVHALFNARKNSKIIISISTHFRGGQREQPLSPSKADVYNYSAAFVYRLGSYYRTDFRIVYESQKSGSKKTHRWSLDIQNLLNRENDGFRYYDPLLKTVLLQKQLGLIPVLSYRLEWGN